MGLNAKDTAWLSGVYREHRERVFRTCLRFAAGDRAWAMDRMQDAFVMLARDLDKVTARDDPGGWLYRAAINVCLMSLRRGRLWSRIENVLRGVNTVHGAQPDRAFRAKRDLTQLERALAKLPPKQRAVFVLVDVEGHSQKEAAELMQLSKGQLSKLHSRALAALQSYQWDVSHD